MNRSQLWLLIIASMVFVGALFLVRTSFADESGQVCYFSVGNFKLFSLYDGSIDFPFEHIIKGDVNFDHPYFHEAAGASLQVPIHVFLLDTGKQVILFDTGLAGMFHSKTGQLAQSMLQAGYQADQITAICITHFHPDHISGLLHADGSKAFAHAQLCVAQAELDYWLQPEVAAQHSSIASFVQKVVALYDVRKFVPGEQLFDGVSVFASFGHTPGHVGFLCESGFQKLLVWGDMIHMPDIQFAHPEISFTDDTDSQQAIATRKQVLQQAVDHEWMIAGVHLASPGVGTIKLVQVSSADKPSYQWAPASPTCS